MKNLLIGFICFLMMPVVKGQSSLRISKQQFRDEFLDAINANRAKGCNCGGRYMPPTSPLIWNDKLANAAREHATDMYLYNYFNHTGPDGRTMQNRIQSAGYNYNGYQSYTIGENIAQGQQTITEVSDDWFKSPSHCKNLMNPAFKEIGIAENNRYWVQDFGGRVRFSSRYSSN